MPTVTTRDALKRIASYPHAVISYLSDDGYPFSVAGDFVTQEDNGQIEIGPLDPEVLPPTGRQVNITVSHIRPVEGYGYDQRRYVSFWGTAQVEGNRLRVPVQRVTGWDEEETPFFEYNERGVPRGRRYMEEISAKPRLGLGWLIFLATRLPFLTATIVPVALGGAMAAYYETFNWGIFLLVLLGACSLHLGLNVANDFFDDLSGADAANVTPTPFSGGSRVIQYGLVSPRTMGLTAASLYLFGAGIGIYLAETRGRWLYVIGIAGIVISLAYTAPPFRLVHRGLGEPAVMLGFGPITTLGAYYVLTGRFSTEALYASIPVAILIALVLYVNQIPDREGDAAAGKRTVVVRWSKKEVVRGYALSAWLAFALIALGGAVGITPIWTQLALLPIPLAVKVWRDIDQYYERPFSLMQAMQANIGLHLSTGLLLVGGYLIAAI